MHQRTKTNRLDVDKRDDIGYGDHNADYGGEASNVALIDPYAQDASANALPRP